MGTATDRATPRTATPKRRFRMVDAMILVAATAAGCALISWLDRATDGEVSWQALGECIRELTETALAWEAASDWEIVFELTYYNVACLVLPLVALWTLAVIPLRLLGPRPRWRRLACQPGLMAACATAVVLVAYGLLIGTVSLVVRREGASWSEAVTELALVGFAPHAPLAVGLAVLASWMTLIVGRRWRAEPSWVDRLGRILGVFWICAGFAITGLMVLYTTIGVGFVQRTISR